MKIDGSAVGLSAQHHKSVVREQYEHLQVRVGGAPGGGSDGRSVPDSARMRPDAQGDGMMVREPGVSPMVARGRALAAQMGQRARQFRAAAREALAPLEAARSDKAEGTGPQNMEELRQAVVRALVKAALGVDIEVFDPAELQGDPEARAKDIASTIVTGSPEMRPLGPPRRSEANAIDFFYERYERYEEHESMSFQASGLIQTSDGQSIEVDLELNMSRSIVSEEYVSVGTFDPKDPLVINFGRPAAELTDTSFVFDLDADGTTETMASLAAGSGMLALDSDGSGAIEDGRELFGALSGDGFGDLAAFDEDGNGWIDEGDSVYQDLAVWHHPGGGGEPELLGLAQVDVGAIFLGSVASPFDLRGDDPSESLGQIRETGIFLQDSGGAGTVQEIDLHVPVVDVIGSPDAADEAEVAAE